MKTRHLLLILIFSLSGLNLFAENDSLENMLSQAVIALMDGDEQAAQGNAPAAAALYEQALELLRGIQESDPAFNTNIVEFRIENLEEKLAEISPETGPAEQPSRVTPDVQDSTHYERLYIEAKEKALADSQRLLEVERRNLDLQMALRERERVLNQQRDQLQESQREIARLQREKESSTQDTTRELQDLRRFNNLLQDRANALETENEGLSEALANVRERDAERAVQIQTFRADLLAAEQALEQERGANEAEIEELRAHLSTCASESRERFEKLEQAYQEIETLREQTAGVPLLEETVIELNRRLNRQTLELEAKQDAEATAKRREAESAELREMLSANLARLTDTLNELTHAHRQLEAKEQRLAEITEQLAELREVIPDDASTNEEETDQTGPDATAEEETAESTPPEE
ncbi:MAG: hypothetical protein JJU05_04920 [Verrucomicrobia bacterium]|nr:hypothetical protein [Verrucomicrobiota bacterium]MCH8526811.1 hypothetical protein [Kiritimatiellia bacterium]